MSFKNIFSLKNEKLVLEKINLNDIIFEFILLIIKKENLKKFINYKFLFLQI